MITADLRELIAHRVEQQVRQSVWDIKRTFTWCGHKIRVTIHHDPFDFQAAYFVELFNSRDLKWSRVHDAETSLYHKRIDTLWLKKMPAETRDEVELLISYLVTVAQDLLEGVDA